MALLSKQQILAAKDIETKDIEVPEWVGSVRIRGLNGAERDEFEQSMVERRGKRYEANLRNARARLVALSVVDADGARLFSEADVNALGNKSASALNRVYEAARDLSGLTEADVDELAENFSGTNGAGSSSG